MTRINVPLWVEVAGVVAIVLSLALVAVEIRQNTNAVSAQAVLALNEEANENNRAVTSDPGLAELLIRTGTDPGSLSTTDLFRLEMHAWSLFNVQESAYTFYQRGMLNESDYTAWRLANCGLLALPGMVEFWRSHSQSFNPEFVRYVNVEVQCGTQAE